MRPLRLTAVFALAAALAPALAWGQVSQEVLRDLQNQAMIHRGTENEVRQKTSEQANAAPPKPAAGPYLLPYWTRGTLKPYGDAATRAWLKYEPLSGQLYSRSATDEPQPVNTDALREFSVGDSLLGTRRTYRRYLDARLADATLRTAFFEVRHEAGGGGSALLCRRTFSQRHPGPTPWPRHRREPKPATYEEQVRYFIKDGRTNSIGAVTLEPAPVLAALSPARQPALAAYVRREGLNLAREADVGRLLAYYDTL